MERETVSKTIFLADDDKDDCQFFSKILWSLSPTAKLDIAYNGKILLEKLIHASHAPDLIVLDLNMPVMDGYESLEKIRNSSEFRNLPVVIMTTGNHDHEQ